MYLYINKQLVFADKGQERVESRNHRVRSVLEIKWAENHVAPNKDSTEVFGWLKKIKFSLTTFKSMDKANGETSLKKLLNIGLKRCGKSCRLRWLNYLRPDIKRGHISVEEEQLIIRLHKLLGHRWALIAGRLPGRTDNEIKNYWHTNLSKKLKGDDNSTSMQLNKSKKKITGCSIKSSKKSSSEEINKPTEPHRVFRTKAVRCTKVVIPRLLDFNQTENNVGAENVVSQSSSALIQEDNNSAISDHDGLLMDNELLLWDALNSSTSSLQANDYHQINENGDHRDRNVANGDHLYHHGLEFSDFAHEAMFEDLLMDERTTRLSDHPFQNNDMMDLKSLELYFLNSEDD